MRIRFKDHQLRRLHEEPNFIHSRFGIEVTKAFRKKVGFLLSARSENDIRAMRSLHYEKLKGKRSHQRSLRLNDQWRLVLEIQTDDNGKEILIVEIVDYH